jgi:hypothetical protein
MNIESGRQAVWQHAKEAGISDDISLIAKYFDIKEVNIFTPENGGKLTFIEQRLAKHDRIAVATKTSMTTKDVINTAKVENKRLK